MPFPVDETWMLAAEEKLGARLPERWRERLMRENGGELSAPPDLWQLLPVRDESDRKRLARTCNDIVLETAKAPEWHDFPTGAVVVGANGSGDLLVFLRNPDGTLDDALRWWDHETGSLYPVDA